MFAIPVSVVFTAVFLATGAYALWRFAQTVGRSTVSPPVPVAARPVELMHVLMSVAMIAMAWGVGGGPATGSGLVQIVVFGLFAVLLGARVLGAPRACCRVPWVLHAAMAVAMVWMVVTMPLFMGGTGSAGAGGHAGHDMPGMDMGGAPDAGAVVAGPPPVWAVAGTWILAAVVLASAAAALTVVVRDRATIRAAGLATTLAATPAATPTATPAEGALLTRPAPVARDADPEGGVLPASCHAVMSLAMAVMLLAML